MKRREFIGGIVGAAVTSFPAPGHAQTVSGNSKPPAKTNRIALVSAGTKAVEMNIGNRISEPFSKNWAVLAMWRIKISWSKDIPAKAEPSILLNWHALS
jgi:hypothetical protein